MSAERLAELRNRYARCSGAPVLHTQWSSSYVRDEVDLDRFRSDGAYIWQSRDGNSAAAYEASAEYVRKIDCAALLERLSEDDAFGVELFELRAGLRVTRDLLDSILEIYALHRVWNILDREVINVLDIGAGYGRFAHRLVTAHPGSSVYCVDAIAESTYVSELYLAHRRVNDRGRVVPFDELPALIERVRPDVAVNMHSFSECSRETIGWWIDLLRRWRIERLLIVPNRCGHDGLRLLSRENSTRLDYVPLLRAAGYRLVTVEPKYLDRALQTHGVSPTHYHFFELA